MLERLIRLVRKVAVVCKNQNVQVRSILRNQTRGRGFPRSRKRDDLHVETVLQRGQNFFLFPGGRRRARFATFGRVGHRAKSLLTHTRMRLVDTSDTLIFSLSIYWVCCTIQTTSAMRVLPKSSKDCSSCTDVCAIHGTS